MDFNICIGKINEYIERKHTSRFEIRRLEVSISREVISSIEKRIWK